VVAGHSSGRPISSIICTSRDNESGCELFSPYTRAPSLSLTNTLTLPQYTKNTALCPATVLQNFSVMIATNVLSSTLDNPRLAYTCSDSGLADLTTSIVRSDALIMSDSQSE